MTPREAIIELNRYIGTEKVSINQQRLNQALGLAIKALKLMIELENKPKATPHGRLIDAEKLLIALTNDSHGLSAEQVITIMEFPTIIEAEVVE